MSYKTFLVQFKYQKSPKTCDFFGELLLDYLGLT